MDTGCRVRQEPSPTKSTAEVIEFKQTVLADLGAEAKVEIQAVGVDLRDDWPAALRAAGFDPATPTAWIAEGLMIGFLPGDAQDHLLDDVTRLSASGSRLAADHVPGSYAVLGEQMRRIGESWMAQGLDADFANLYYAGDHHNAATYLQERGWKRPAPSTRICSRRWDSPNRQSNSA